jgi:hypothetical protein
MKFLYNLNVGGFSRGFHSQDNVLLNPVSNIGLNGHAVKTDSRRWHSDGTTLARKKTFTLSN